MLVRDRAHIEREYGQEKWASVLTFIQNSRETDLSRMIAAIEEFENKDLDEALRYAAFYTDITHRLLRICRTLNPDAIVELGAGWSRNLFRLWLAGGPRDAEYMAFELTEPGREAIEKLHWLRPGMDIVAWPFDFGDLRPIVSNAQRALVFTVFSIAELPLTPPGLLDFMKSLGNKVIGFHVEPHRTAYSVKHDYNSDFWEVMTGASVNMLESRPMLYAPNPENPAGLFVWSS